jgi:hypothetical protein
MQLCNEQNTESCIVQLEYKFSNVYVLTICRAPTGHFKIFVKKLENINYLHKTEAGSVVCGETNTHYLAESYHKQCLNSIQTSFNL